MSQVTPNRIRRIKGLSAEGLCAADIARRVGLSLSTVQKVRLGHYDRVDQPNGEHRPRGRAVWCEKCRCHVYPPCKACRLRERVEENHRDPTPLPQGIYDPEITARLQLSLVEIGLLVRTVSFLEKHGIYTVNDLLHRSPDEILQIENVGRQTLEEIYGCLERFGFKRGTRDEK